MCSITSHLWTCQKAYTPGVELHQLQHRWKESTRLSPKSTCTGRWRAWGTGHLEGVGAWLGDCWFQKQSLPSSLFSTVPALENYCQSPGGLVGWECLQRQDLKGLLGLAHVATVNVLPEPSLRHQALHLNHKVSPSNLTLPPPAKKCHRVSKTPLKNSVLAFSWPI